MERKIVAAGIVLMSVFFVPASYAAETNAYYTVTVNVGTKEDPVSIDGLDVVVEKPGAEPQTKSL